MRGVRVAALALCVSACGNVIIGTPGAQPTVPLRMGGTPAEATVTIDDQRVGSLALVAARGMRVLPGRHRITVESAGYLPWDQVVEAKGEQNEVVKLDVRLVPVPE
jgi:hypothetical protein